MHAKAKTNYRPSPWTLVLGLQTCYFRTWQSLAFRAHCLATSTWRFTNLGGTLLMSVLAASWWSGGKYRFFKYRMGPWNEIWFQDWFDSAPSSDLLLYRQQAAINTGLHNHDLLLYSTIGYRIYRSTVNSTLLQNQLHRRCHYKNQNQHSHYHIYAQNLGIRGMKTWYIEHEHEHITLVPKE